ncbi:hypothetical protein [Piscirickettsia salmonis]|uniref:hypothetical protein n=1 Tax=Piscirickettsia salmonis TaxID=1238 RepID=UPI0007C89DFE|nr:hypothetical protein A0O36_00079 [Piscirickettsiaceae bacterium NZ-RLO1]
MKLFFENGISLEVEEISQEGHVAYLTDLSDVDFSIHCLSVSDFFKLKNCPFTRENKCFILSYDALINLQDLLFEVKQQAATSSANDSEKTGILVKVLTKTVLPILTKSNAVKLHYFPDYKEEQLAQRERGRQEQLTVLHSRVREEQYQSAQKVRELERRITAIQQQISEETLRTSWITTGLQKDVNTLQDRIAKEARHEKQPSGTVKNLQCQADGLQKQLSEGMPLKSPQEIASLQNHLETLQEGVLKELEKADQVSYPVWRIGNLQSKIRQEKARLSYKITELQSQMTGLHRQLGQEVRQSADKVAGLQRCIADLQGQVRAHDQRTLRAKECKARGE